MRLVRSLFGWVWFHTLYNEMNQKEKQIGLKADSVDKSSLFFFLITNVSHNDNEALLVSAQ